MDRSKNLALSPGAAAGGRLDASDPQGIEPLLRMIDYLIPETGKIEPIAEYFLRMARMSLLEAEQKRADEIGRH